MSKLYFDIPSPESITQEKLSQTANMLDVLSFSTGHAQKYAQSLLKPLVESATDEMYASFLGDDSIESRPSIVRTVTGVTQAVGVLAGMIEVACSIEAEGLNTEIKCVVPAISNPERQKDVLRPCAGWLTRLVFWEKNKLMTENQTRRIIQIEEGDLWPWSR